jgi:hypothetical protein
LHIERLRALSEKTLARKRKRKTFSATKAVKAVAREKIGAVPPTRSVPDRKKRQACEKYKPTIERLLEQSE